VAKVNIEFCKIELVPIAVISGGRYGMIVRRRSTEMTAVPSVPNPTILTFPVEVRRIFSGLTSLEAVVVNGERGGEGEREGRGGREMESTCEQFHSHASMSDHLIFAYGVEVN
jgi:hypothetical protein